MIQGLGSREQEFEEEQHDTELTLGPGMLALLGGGLLLLCGLCFGLGYVAGNHHAAPIDAAAPTAAQAVTQIGVATTKPQAALQVPAPPQTNATTQVPTDSSADSGAVQSAPGAGGVVPTTTASASQTLVRPALPQQGFVQPANPGVPGITGQVQPAMTQGTGVMVQIATFAQAEDADVLVNALRRRGYAVNVRRDVLDSSLHVQIGPFANRNDANVMRQRLLNDGYNAVVLP
jgi:DedD protein